MSYGQNQFNNTNEVKSSKGELFLSGNKSVNYRLGLVNGMGAFGLTSTKLNIDNSQFWSNEYGIPVNGLDIKFPVSAITLGIASTNTNDTLLGTGARIIQIIGLNSNYDIITEIVELNGQTEVNTTKLFLRVNDVTVISKGSVGWNQGTIYIGGSDNVFTLGEPNLNVYRTVGIDPIDGKGIGASTPSTFTIARGYTGVPLNFKVSTDATEAKPLLVRGIVQPFGLGEITIGNLVFNGAREFTFDGFSTLGEKGDIIIRTMAKSPTNVSNSVVFWEWNVKKN